MTMPGLEMRLSDFQLWLSVAEPSKGNDQPTRCPQSSPRDSALTALVWSSLSLLWVNEFVGYLLCSSSAWHLLPEDL